jgi:class 3 adenylate cyclase
VLLPADQVADLPAGIVATPVGALALRGFNEPVPVVELSGQPPLASRNDTGELWMRPPLVG